MLTTAHATVHTLHGAMPLAAQDAELAPAPRGSRKIVLATSVAETSLTIEGVQVVIDAGFSRLPRYEPRVGLTRLEIVALTSNLASQRVAQAIGATFECTARSRLHFHGKPHDALVYSLTPADAGNWQRQ